MERLTAQNGDGTYYYPECMKRCDGEPKGCESCSFEMEACDQLGLYEDTGFTPEKIHQILIEKEKDCSYRAKYEIEMETNSKLMEEIYYYRKMAKDFEKDIDRMKAVLSMVHLIFGGNQNV